MRIFLTGATGFIGSHLRRALVRDGHEVVGLARRPQREETGVQWVIGEVDNLDTLAHGMHGCDAVIHLIGIIHEKGDVTFQRMHVHTTEVMLAAMRRAKVKRLLHMSALGAGPKQSTEYFRTKWAAEELVRASGLEYTIFRPSLIFGPGDGFVSTLVDQLRLYPIIPIPGSGDYPMAPISIYVVETVFLQALDLDGSTSAKTFEMCGPEVLTYARIVDLLADHLRIRKLRVHIPISLLRLGIKTLNFLRLPSPITQDQLTMLLQGSVCEESSAAHVFDLPHITLTEGIREYVQPRR